MLTQMKERLLVVGLTVLPAVVLLAEAAPRIKF